MQRADRLHSGLVLVVDDNPDVLELTSLLLRGDGHRVREAHDGLAALEVLAELELEDETPTVIILDLMMPVMDGPTFLKHLRRTNADLPVIVATASGKTAVQGAQHVMAKPIEPKRLRSLVRSYCA